MIAIRIKTPQSVRQNTGATTTTKHKSNTVADVEGIASQVIAEKHGAKLGHPALLDSPSQAKRGLEWATRHL
jgi:hypothetical protein